MRLPPPPARLSTISTEERAQILAGRDDAWIEKSRRFCSLHGRHLRRTSRERFGAEADAHLRWMTSLLLLVPEQGILPCDPARLSAALYAIDAQKTAPQEQKLLASEQVAVLLAWHRSGNRQSYDPAQGPVFGYMPGRWRIEAPQAPRVLVLSPNPFSLYTLAVMRLCLSLEIPIAGLLVRSFTLSRFLDEYRRDGPRLLRKVWRKLVLRGDENADSSTLSLSELLKHLDNNIGDARSLAKANNIPILSAAEWNAEPVITWVHEQSPRLGLFTGGGMTRSGLQACFPMGILNVHLGHLPGYKGMDVVENPVLEGRRNNVGATAHIMDEGLDTGPIVQRLNFDPDSSNSLGSLRNKIAGLMPLIAIDSALGLGSGRLACLPQDKRGRQYFITHPALRPVLDAAIASHSSKAPGDFTDIYTKVVSDL